MIHVLIEDIDSFIKEAHRIKGEKITPAFTALFKSGVTTRVCGLTIRSIGAGIYEVPDEWEGMGRAEYAALFESLSEQETIFFQRNR